MAVNAARSGQLLDDVQVIGSLDLSLRARRNSARQQEEQLPIHNDAHTRVCALHYQCVILYRLRKALLQTQAVQRVPCLTDQRHSKIGRGSSREAEGAAADGQQRICCVNVKGSAASASIIRQHRRSS